MEKINFYTAIAFCLLSLLFGIQHVVTYFMIRGKNLLEMLRVDAEWIVAGCDDSLNSYVVFERSVRARISHFSFTGTQSTQHSYH